METPIGKRVTEAIFAAMKLRQALVNGGLRSQMPHIYIEVGEEAWVQIMTSKELQRWGVPRRNWEPGEISWWLDAFPIVLNDEDNDRIAVKSSTVIP